MHAELKVISQLRALITEPENRRKALILAATFGAVAVIALALGSFARPGPGVAVDWNAVAAVATVSAVVAAVAMWRTDASERVARADAAAKVTTLLLLPELSEARHALNEVLPGIDEQDELNCGILDFMVGSDASLREETLNRAQELVSSALEGIEPRLASLPVSLTNPLAHALVALKGLKSAASHLQQFDSISDEQLDTRMEGFRRAHRGAEIALAKAHTACESFVISELEDYCV
jgi:hypothetical protein